MMKRRTYHSIAWGVLCSCVLGTLHATHANHQTHKQERLAKIKQRFHSPTIKVLLAGDVEGAIIEIKGSYNIYDPYTADKLYSAFTPATNYMYPTRDGLKWGQEFPGIYQLLLVPDDCQTPILVNGVEYSGMVAIYQLDGSIGIVNEVPVEDFVASCLTNDLAGKVPSKEGIAACAIALRTKAYEASLTGQTPYWDVKAEAWGYEGSSDIPRTTSFQDALRASQDMVLQLVSQKNSSPELPDITWFSQAKTAVPFTEINALAKDGKNAREILEHFFARSTIALVTHSG